MGRQKQGRVTFDLQMDCADSAAMCRGLKTIFKIIEKGKIHQFETGNPKQYSPIIYKGEIKKVG